MVTRRPNPLGTSGSGRTILVCTYDKEDEADMERIYKELRRLGFAYRRPHKTGKDTAMKRRSYGGFQTRVRYYG